jgi:uncharacterized membrane protein YGL010W
MRNTSDLLARYATFHRDERNVATHFVGVPMIVFALGVLLNRPAIELGAVSVTPAWLLFAAASGWYLSRGSVLLGAMVSFGIGVLTLLAHRVGGGLGNWLGWGLGLLALGWLVQSLGHWYEGRKPSGMADITGFLVAPMFVAAEALFAMGWNKPLRAEIEHRAGPKHVRDMAQMA